MNIKGVLYPSLAASINIINTQEHHQKMNVGLGYGKLPLRLSCQDVPKVVKSTLVAITAI